jgi:glucokinase-like ROK family protein
MKKTNQGDTRLHNSRLVLSTIYHQGEISRVQVSRITHLTRTTVSDIVTEFMETGLVDETGLSSSTGGKPATLLRVNVNSRLMVGVDLGESEFRGGLVNLRGEILHRVHIPVGGRDGDSALELVCALVEKLLDAAQAPVIGIGVGTPGLMDPPNGTVRQAINLNWQDLPLGDLLLDRFHVPVWIANDCQVAALGEFIFGEIKTDHLILIKAGRGVGAGIVLGGNLFYGDNAGAGEIGHIRILEDGKRCRCGNIGCLETVLSDRALVQQARRIAKEFPKSILNQLVSGPEEINFETVITAYREGDSSITALVDWAAQKLGGVVATLVGALNVNTVLVAGNLSLFGDGLLEPLRKSVQRGTLPSLALQTKVGTASLGDDIVILGAASLVLRGALGLF